MTDDTRLRDYLRRVTADLHRSKQRLREVESAATEPVAIVGMACRFPGGVGSPDDLWELLGTGADVREPLPADRGWDLAALHRAAGGTTLGAGFLRDVGDFDAGFFGISPREALAMDPQQRILLETSWEALENAALGPGTLRGSDTGVFVGASGSGYGTDLHDVPDGVGGFLVTGGAGSVVSGRIAYTFGLEGPTVTIDTACSSSLVALHYAMRSLRAGECSLALVGGVSVMAAPTMFTEVGEKGGLAGDGLCKAFAAAADGTGFSEGAAVIVVERLSEARRQGHQVLAVVRGSAVNQDGASSGLTTPNGPSQQRVIRAALADARLAPSDVDVVEAHGTGTTLGDPIEAQALLATYGRDRAHDEPLWLGSVKSNIGHTQCAAGLAGVIKLVLALRHEKLPRTLHVDAPTPQVDWSTGAVELLTETRPWPRMQRRRRAAVSSFGISGTNAHVVIEEAPALAAADEPPPAPPITGDVLAWALSAKTPEALAGQARRLGAYAAGAARPDLADVGWSLLTGRSPFRERAVVLGAARPELLAGLTTLGTAADPGEAAAAVVRGTVVEGADRPVFVFPGQGSQWAGMAAQLRTESPVFAAALDECGAALAPFVDWKLTEVLADPDRLSNVDVVQPALFAVLVSLARLWQAVGVRPAAVLGHSQGEIAAAVVAGALTLDDGARVVALRSAAIAAGLAGKGAMVSVTLPENRVRDQLAGRAGQLSIAAVNSPTSTVVAGDPGALDDLIAAWETEGVPARRVQVDYASHTAQVEQVRDRILRDLAPITPVQPAVPMFSTVTGAWLDTPPDAAYWVRNLREPVGFAACVAALLEEGFGAFLECSAHPVLTAGIREIAGEQAAEVVVTGSLRRDDGGARRMLTSLAEAYTGGVPVDWTTLFPGARHTALPTYAFQRERLWWDEEAVRRPSDPADDAFWHAVEDADLESLATTLDFAGAALGEVLPALARWRAARRELSAANSWAYRVRWPALTGDRPASAGGRWLIVSPESENAAAIAESCARALQTHGAQARVVRTGARDRAALTELLTAEDDVTGILSLLPLDEEPLDGHRSVPAGYAGTVALTQALGDAGGTAPLWCVTQGAVPAGPADAVRSPRQALVWGFGRVAGLEHPERWGGLIDLPAVVDDRAAALLGNALSGADGEDQLAVRPSGLLARRLVPVPATASTEAPALRGTVLVTGGTGGLGSRVARWAVAGGADRVVVVGRRGPDAPGAADLVEALGARVSVVSCDVGDRTAVESLVAGLGAELRAVVHTAAVLDDAVIDGLRPDQIDRVLRVKADGARYLHEVTSGTELDAFVLFSSVAGTLGASGQGNYAPGNAYLDGLAEYRRGLGLPATSIAWGPWAGPGMGDSPVGQVAERHGMPMLDPDRAVAAMGAALTRGDTTVVLAHIDWARFHVAYTANRPSPFLTGVPAVRSLRAATGNRTDPRTGGLAERLAALTGERERDDLVLTVVRDQAAQVLGHAGGRQIDPRQGFRDQGFDSVLAVELRNRLTAATGLRLPATLIFDHPNARSLAARVRRELLGEAETETATVTMSSATADDAEPIAVVGMSCRLPGGVRNPEELWRLLLAGGDGITGFPHDRGWDTTALYHPDPAHPGTSYAAEGGFLHDADKFDAAFFDISPREALAMDPQQRLLLEASWEALEHAGIDPSALRGTAAGVFVGTNGQDYTTLLTTVPPDVEGYLGIGNTASVMSGRVAYALGLEGPAITLDTACSSSLVALHLGVQSLRRGECALALTGGVTLMSTPGVLTEFSRQRGLAPDGRAKAFAAAADGTAFSEGIGIMVLERLSDARRHHHRILAVVRGSAVNQDGASNGLTSPNGPAQQRVIRAALADARLTAADVDAVEAHGTGTTLGDPIEAQALLATYGRDRGEPLWLGSIKSNIGHTQAAAGVAGAMKMVLGLQHGILPRTLHVDAPTPEVDWSSGAVELLSGNRPWPRTDRPRRAGVSSFGISGTNAHVILEQAPDAPAGETPDPEPAVTPVVLSGRTGEALRAQAARLAAHLEARPELTLGEVGSALVRSRAAFEHRAVVLSAARDDLPAALRALAAGEDAPDLVRGTADNAAARPVFVFPGQGSQWVGMARELIGSSPVFAGRMAQCAVALSSFVEWELVEVLDDAEALGRVDVVQPVLFAVMVSLAELWRWFGVVPAAVVGHSQGEIAAAVVAGGLTLEDGARVVALRSRAIAETLAGKGGMLSIAEPAESILARLADFSGLSVAALNGPNATVVAGDPPALRAFAADCERRGTRTRPVPVDYASHCVQVEDVRDRLLTALAPISPRTAGVPLFSTVTQDWLDTTAMDAGYWYRNLRETVRFEGAVRALTDLGYGAFIEVSAHPVLVPAIQETVPDDRPVALLGTLRRDDGGLRRVLASVAEAFTNGVPVDWKPALPDRGPVDLPTYAFRRQRYWWDPAHRESTAATDPAESAFWQAVADADTDSLAATLGIDVEPLGQVLPALVSWHRRQRADNAVDSWRYRFDWAPLEADDDARLTGTWWILTPAGDSPAVPLLRAALLRRGAGAVAVVDAAAADDRAALTMVLAAAYARDGEPAGILALPVIAGHLADHEAAAWTASLIQALGGVTGAPLWCATGDAADPAQAAVWGLGRVAALEHPDRWGGLIELPESVDEPAAARVAGVLAGERGEDQVAVRATGVFGRRLRRSSPALTRDLPIAKTVLITGGTGALGRHVARWLLGSGADHVILAGRRGAAAPGIAELRTEFGPRVSAPSCDVTDRQELAALLADHRVDGVIHAAGVLDDGVVEALTPDRFATVFAPKALAARHLDELTRERHLEYFVLFSSAAGAIGNAGQGNYAAANAYLDALAEQRHRAGLPATSIAWGAWAGDGLAAGALDRMDREGVPVMEPGAALTALGRVLRQENPVEVVARIDWARMLTATGSARPVPALAELPEVIRLTRTHAATRVDTADLAARLTALPAAERAEEVTALVRTHAAAVLGHDSPGGVEPRRAFKELGLDSLAAVELRNRLVAATGLRLPASAVFDHPTVTALSERICAGLAPVSAATADLSPFEALDRVELSLTGADTPDRARLRRRLAGLLARCDKPAETVGGGLLVASDDEVFDFIGKEFGIS